jgi:hypothetical protein
LNVANARQARDWRLVEAALTLIGIPCDVVVGENVVRNVAYNPAVFEVMTRSRRQ